MFLYFYTNLMQFDMDITKINFVITYLSYYDLKLGLDFNLSKNLRKE